MGGKLNVQQGRAMGINIYNDEKIDTTGAHGTDIAAQRMDDLDRACLGHIIRHAPLGGVALDIGSGSGYHALRMAALGARVVSVDLMDMRAAVAAVTGAYPALDLRHVVARIEEFARPEGRLPVSILYSQRMFHYLRFEESVRILSELRSWMAPEARAYISVSGLESELGQGYGDAGKPVRDRWARLAGPMGAKHGILEPVCLYREADMVALAKAAGFAQARVWSSAFGNIKAVFET